MMETEQMVAQIREAALAVSDFPDPLELTRISIMGSREERSKLSHPFARAADQLYKLAILIALEGGRGV